MAVCRTEGKSGPPDVGLKTPALMALVSEPRSQCS